MPVNAKHASRFQSRDFQGERLNQSVQLTIRQRTVREETLRHTRGGVRTGTGVYIRTGLSKMKMAVSRIRWRSGVIFPFIRAMFLAGGMPRLRGLLLAVQKDDGPASSSALCGRTLRRHFQRCREHRGADDGRLMPHSLT